ncbi:MAG: primosome assembly protein PriA [Pseudonocardiales bacterium]|nr:primosome assembly protein PriA [Pseudonocardiales bacterium]
MPVPLPAPEPVVDPVARLMVDVALSHLDRPFDYLVPGSLDALVVPGARVRVRFAGRLVDAYVLERVSTTDHEGRLAPIERVVGTEPVLTAATSALFRAVADRWAGSFVDVVRLGVPQRHARAETTDEAAAVGPPEPPDRAQWARYTAGASYVDAVTDGRAPKAVWSALPGEQWPARYAEAVQAALAGGRGALVVVPDARDLERLSDALVKTIGTDAFVALSADLGPAKRYRRWIAVRRGQVRAVIGTRGAAFAPVADLGLVAVWDDGDDLHAEPRAPYPNVRDVLVLRSRLEGAALLVGGYARTAEAQLLVDSGWAHEISGSRNAVRTAAPRISATGGDFEQGRDPVAAAARLPSLAMRTARLGLASGRPVLVQVPRAGYAPALACVRDRTPARCVVCSGPLASAARGGIATCHWCGRPAADWACPICGGRQLRAQVTGSVRTAEELGRAFPGVTVRSSGGETVLATVPGQPALVVATPGAEPVADGGYAAALLLDGWALLGRADLRAGEETLRRWMNAAALVASDGEVVVAADAAVPTVQALVRWDPAGHATRELSERAELGFPPVTRMAALRGTGPALADFISLATLPAATQQIGPIEQGAQQQLLLRVPRRDGAALAAALHAASAVRSARKAPDSVRVALDPAELG